MSRRGTLAFVAVVIALAAVLLALPATRAGALVGLGVVLP